jgi:hypothetical protein
MRERSTERLRSEAALAGTFEALRPGEGSDCDPKAVANAQRCYLAAARSVDESEVERISYWGDVLC